MNRFSLFVTALAFALPTAVTAQGIPVEPIATPSQTGAIALGTGGVPGMPAESWFTLAGRPTVRNVATATLLPVLPDKAKATGAAVIIAPGGGFLMESMEAEAMKPARWLADHGIAAFVLKYRLDATPASLDAFKQAAVARFAAAAAAGAKGGAVIPAPAPALADAQAAVKLVRARAGEWGVDPRRVAYLGFSAGAIMGVDLMKTAAPGSTPARQLAARRAAGRTARLRTWRPWLRLRRQGRHDQHWLERGAAYLAWRARLADEIAGTAVSLLVRMRNDALHVSVGECGTLLKFRSVVFILAGRQIDHLERIAIYKANVLLRPRRWQQRITCQYKAEMNRLN